MQCHSQQANAITGGNLVDRPGSLVRDQILVARDLDPGRDHVTRSGVVSRAAVGWHARCVLDDPDRRVGRLFRFSMAFFFVALGLYVIFSAMVKPDVLRKPYVDNTLE